MGRMTIQHKSSSNGGEKTVSATTGSSSGGIGFFGLLAVLFIGLKLTHYIDWSWWLVLAPIWGSIVFVFIVIAFVAGVIFVMEKSK